MKPTDWTVLHDGPSGPSSYQLHGPDGAVLTVTRLAIHTWRWTVRRGDEVRGSGTERYHVDARDAATECWREAAA